MAGNELATAYLTLVPSLKGAQASITKQLGGVDTTSAGKQMGDKASSGFGGGFNIKGLAVAAAATAATAAAVKFVDIMTDSLWAYADREQLVGGVETLFKESSGQLQEYAAQAYKTAGVSANDYMATVTSFSGALLRSLSGNTEEAVRLSDVAMRDMADQVNKYGTSMQTVQDTYLSLARGNYQTLDNLFGGMFGGTKEGLREMLDYAEQYRASLGETVSYSEESYADIVSAIHDVSVAQGIAGTTAAEAADTISGSVASMKAKWNDWLVALADGNADVTAETEALVEAVTIAIKNILPVVGQILVSILHLIAQKMIDMMQAGLDLIKNFAQGIVEGFPFVLSEIGRGISEGVDRIKEKWDDFWNAGRYVTEGLAGGISSAAREVATSAANVASQALSAARNTLAVRSPSRKAFEIGAYFSEGMALGIADKARSVTDAVTGMTGGMLNAATTTATPALSAGGAGFGNGTTYITLNCDIKDLQGIQTLNDFYGVLARAKAINPNRR